MRYSTVTMYNKADVYRTKLQKVWCSYGQGKMSVTVLFNVKKAYVYSTDVQVWCGYGSGMMSANPVTVYNQAVFPQQYVSSVCICACDSVPSCTFLCHARAVPVCCIS